MTNDRPWINFTSSGRRPNATARRRTSAACSCACLRWGAMENVASACCAATSLPLGDEPAWKSSGVRCGEGEDKCGPRSEEHTSELQSRGHLVCRLLLE